jgi:hypothetical protein
MTPVDEPIGEVHMARKGIGKITGARKLKINGRRLD